MSPRQLARLAESRRSDSFDDQKSAAAIASAESTCENHQQFLEYLISQVKRIIHGDEVGNWHDDPVTVFGEDASLYALLQASQSKYQPVECLSTDLVGDFVCTRGDRTGNFWRVQKGDPEDEALMPVKGVIVSKSSTVEAIIQVSGPCTLFSGLDYSKPSYHLGTAGIQYSLPNPGPSGYVMVQRVGTPVASDILWLTLDAFLTKRRA